MRSLWSCPAPSPPLSPNRGRSTASGAPTPPDNGATKYSPLDQIDADNVDQLQIAWTRPTVDQSILDVVPNLGYNNANRSTPLMVDGIVYAPNAVGLVEAWDPATGETLWVQQAVRGGAGGLPRGGAPRHRVLDRWGTSGASSRIGESGSMRSIPRPAEPYRDFGDNGRVDLKTGLAEGARYRWGGAPTVVRDTIVMGQSMGDTFFTKEDIRGDVRAFDVRTGELKWIFHTIPQGGRVRAPTPGATVRGSSAATRRSGRSSPPTRSSATSTCRPPRPPTTCTAGTGPATTCSPSRSSASTVETGERVWHYQLVHHGLWDYDIPAAPILADLTVDGRDNQGRDPDHQAGVRLPRSTG